MNWYRNRQNKGDYHHEKPPAEISVQSGETETHSKGSKEVDVYDPYPVWKRKRLQDNPARIGTWTDAMWLAEWDALVPDPTTPKVFTRGQWCVGEFGGAHIAQGRSRSFHT